MAFIVVLPIPFGNLLPALATMLIGVGLVFRDGVAVLLGLVMAGLAMFVTASLMLMAWAWGSAWLVGAYFSPSWTAFQAERGRHFSVIVDGISN